MQSLNRSVLRSIVYANSKPNTVRYQNVKGLISNQFKLSTSPLTGTTTLLFSNNSQQFKSIRNYSTPSNNDFKNDTIVENPINTSEINRISDINVSPNLVDTVAAVPPPPPNPIVEAINNFNDSIVESVNQFCVNTGIPWWLTIIGATVALRFVILPFTVKIQRNQVKMQKVREEIEKHSYLNDGTMEGRMKLMSLQAEVQKKAGVSPLSMLGIGLAQAPFYIYFFVLVRSACLDFPQFVKEGGALWFKDLSVMDPTYILPVASSVLQLASVRMSFNEATPLIMKIVFTGLCFIPLFFTLSFPAGLNVYWCINSGLFVAQNYIFKQNAVKRFFNIPIIEESGAEKKTIQYAPEKRAITLPEDLLKKESQEKLKKIEKIKQEISTIKQAKQKAMEENFGGRRK